MIFRKRELSKSPIIKQQKVDRQQDQRDFLESSESKDEQEIKNDSEESIVEQKFDISDSKENVKAIPKIPQDFVDNHHENKKISPNKELQKQNMEIANKPVFKNLENINLKNEALTLPPANNNFGNFIQTGKKQINVLKNKKRLKEIMLKMLKDDKIIIGRKNSYLFYLECLIYNSKYKINPQNNNVKLPEIGQPKGRNPYESPAQNLKPKINMRNKENCIRNRNGAQNHGAAQKNFKNMPGPVHRAGMVILEKPNRCPLLPH